MEAPWAIAEHFTYDELRKVYDRESFDLNNRQTEGRVLSGAIRNSSIRDRVAISQFLLDEGLDPLLIDSEDNVNVLHVLFSVHSGHDYASEAPILKRLLDSGADMTLRSPRFGTPWDLFLRIPRDIDDPAPFYDAIFDRPDLDLDQMLTPEAGVTVRDFLYALPPAFAPLTERARAYDQAHPTPNTPQPTTEDATHD